MNFKIANGILTWTDGSCKPAEDEHLMMWEKIKELQAEVERLKSEQRWIPVSKRLPKPYESVLAWVGGGLEILFIETRLDGSNPRWNKVFSSDPTHWMPLPEPPAQEPT